MHANSICEASRLSVVRQFLQLNLEYHDELQKTVLFAAKLCHTPICCINLIDADTQWIKVKKGLDITQAPLDQSFCCHTLKQKRLLIIPDTLLDARFKAHPNVIGRLKIRFYAAVPLITQDGNVIGTFCVMDTKPHQLQKQEKLIFKILAKHTVSVMELKLSFDTLDDSFTELKTERENRMVNDVRLQSMFESLTDSYFLLGKDGEILDFNRASYRNIKEKYGEKLSRGRPMTDFLPNDYKEQFCSCLQDALHGEKVQIERLDDYGEKGSIWWDCVFEAFKSSDGEITGISYVARNINERKLNEEKILEQNRMLCRIAEIQSHDYRGPVATILGLMNLIEQENYDAPKEYLIMLHETTKKLEQKIKQVVSLVNSELMLIPG